MVGQDFDLPQDVLDHMNASKDTEVDGKDIRGNEPDDAVVTGVLSVLEKLRDEAVQFRKESGIEEVWTLCEERYHGIDDANRHEYKDLRFIKPTVMNAPVTTDMSGQKNRDLRSTVFVRLSSRYVDTAAAKVGEILLDDKSFSFGPTPVPELLDGKDDMTPVVEDGKALTRPRKPSDPAPQPAELSSPATQPAVQPAAPPSPPGQVAPPGASVPGSEAGPSATPSQSPAPVDPNQVPLTTHDLVEEAIELATVSAKKAERRIWDWQIECNINAELRKVIRDAARLGVGVIKGPFPQRSRTMAMKKGEDGKMKLEIGDKISPASEWKNPWNIFPDPGCGDSIRKGDFIFERDYLSTRRVRAMKLLPGYYGRQIDKVLLHDPGKSGSISAQDNGTIDPGQAEAKRKSLYLVWYFTGMLDRKHFEQLNPRAATLLKKSQDQVFVVATIIEGCLVKCTLNPLYSGDLNYHSVPWLPRGEFWAGTGPCEQVHAAQKIVNAATRAMMNNAGVASGGQIVIDQDAVEPADGQWTITPNKIWYKTNNGTVDDVRKAFWTFNIEARVDELMKIIEYGMRLGEESTSIPLVTQGMSGATTPQTLGQAQLQNNNANQLLRSVGYSFDDYFTDPHTRQYYEWLLLDENVPDNEKGDHKIFAKGSTTKVERTIQDAGLMELSALAATPGSGADLRKWFKTLLKSRHIDPTEVQMSEDEQKKKDAEMAKQPAPNIQIAQIKQQIAEKQMAQDAQLAQAEMALEKELALNKISADQAMGKLVNETQRLRNKLDVDRDTIYAQTQRESAQADYQHAMEKLKLERELAIMQYANKNQLNLDAIKAKLEDSAMKLRTQKELAAAAMSIDVHKHNVPQGSRPTAPAVQVPGRAPNGRAEAQI